MTDREYNNFRIYVCDVKGFDIHSGRKYASDFRGQEAEDYLLETGKIVLIDREPDKRGRVYRDAYLVINGSEDYFNYVMDILFTKEVYTGTLYAHYGTKRTILLNRNLPNRIIREV